MKAAFVPLVVAMAAHLFAQSPCGEAIGPIPFQERGKCGDTYPTKALLSAALPNCRSVLFRRRDRLRRWAVRSDRQDWFFQHPNMGAQEWAISCGLFRRIAHQRTEQAEGGATASTSTNEQQSLFRSSSFTQAISIRV